jgi:hypothetical protein
MTGEVKRVAPLPHLSPVGRGRDPAIVGARVRGKIASI